MQSSTVMSLKTFDSFPILLKYFFFKNLHADLVQPLLEKDEWSSLQLCCLVYLLSAAMSKRRMEVCVRKINHVVSCAAMEQSYSSRNTSVNGILIKSW